MLGTAGVDIDDTHPQPERDPLFAIPVDRMERDIIYRRDSLHPSIEISRHPICGAEVELLVTAIGEVKKP